MDNQIVEKDLAVNQVKMTLQANKVKMHKVQEQLEVTSNEL